MRAFVLQLAVIVVSGCLLIPSNAAPADKEKAKTKLKSHDKEGSKITDEERRFLKEVEAKFKINTKENEKLDIKKILEKKTKGLKLPFPAVIAVEIVNDTTPDGKGKRTIDANLGYGYKTDNGYFYQKFGAPEEKGKFMIYPYSQQDIPPARPNAFSSNSHYSAVYTNKDKGEKTYVDIQPSKAYQLVPIDSSDNQGGHDTYNPNDVVSYLRTKYESVQAIETPPPPRYSAAEDYYQQHSQQESPKIYYSTYNGHGQLSEFSGSFPSVMSNYYVNPSQLLGGSQYHHLGSIQQEAIPGPKRVIPVFILRIPSSQITHEHASAFNQLNLQSLVSQYLAQLQPHVIPKPMQHQQAYYQRRPVMYSTPSTISHYSSPQYVDSEQTEYGEPQQYEEEQPKVQYVTRYQTKSLPSTQMTFSHIYSSLSKDQQQQYPSHYTHNQGGSQDLPISENYPDHLHTRVVFKPQYAKDEQETSYNEDDTSGYSTTSPEAQTHSFRAFIRHQPQISIVPNGHAVAEDTHAQYESYGTQQDGDQKEVEEEQYYQASNQEEHSQGEAETPYNYHAHPNPKRQTKHTESGTKRQTQKNKRPLRSGTDTAVLTKLR